MFLVVDLGNTNIVFALFKGKKLQKRWRYPTCSFKVPKLAKKAKAVIVSSVVPKLNSRLKKAFKGKKIIWVKSSLLPQIKVRLRDKKSIGADRLVNALAAHRLFKGTKIVVDFGTATTFDVVSSKGEYLGGAIAPGILMARDALYSGTAKLPRIKIKNPKNLIGRTTQEAMQSGLVNGYASMVEGMIRRIKSEIPACRQARRDPKSEIVVIATGGLAKLICKHTGVVDRIEPDLTLKGLQMIGAEINE